MHPLAAEATTCTPQRNYTYYTVLFNLRNFLRVLILMTMKKLITYITTFYPTNDRPWHGIFFKDHAEAMGAFEDVAVIHVQTPSVKQLWRFKGTVQHYYENGVYTLSVSQPVLTHRIKPLIKYAYRKAAEKGLQLVQAHYNRKPDFLVAQCVLPAGQIALALSKKEQIPYGVIDHFSFLGDMLEEQASQIMPVYEKAKFNAAVSGYLSETIKEFMRNDNSVPVTGNVLGQIFEQTEPVQSTHCGSKPFKWLFIGPDDRDKKGVDILHRALQLLDDTNWNLSIVGQGRFSALKNSSYAHRVTHFPQQTRHEILASMQNHHALVSTSRIETFGMAIVEMLSQGRPVVATKCGGPQEYVKPFCGSLIETNSPEQTARAMQHLMENYDDYPQMQIRDYILKKYGCRPFYNKMNRLFAWSEKQKDY